MATIVNVKAGLILDSFVNPTLEVDVQLSDGTLARAAVPTGASTGFYVAPGWNFNSDNFIRRALKAVYYVNSIIGPALVGMDPAEQTAIDYFIVQKLGGTVNAWGWNNQELVASAKLAVSLAVCKAGARVKRIPLYKHIANLAGNKNLVLPVPALNVINGGSHAGNKLAMQVNQTGCETQSIKAATLSGWVPMASQCSGKIVDTCIADHVVSLATVTAALSANVVAGHLPVANLSAYTLFDSGATHSFISTDHVKANQLHFEKYVTSQTFTTALPSGDVLESTQFLRAVPIIVSGRELCVDLIVLAMYNYDVILGMDFLTKYNASIECGMRSVTFRPNIEDEFTFKAEPYPIQKAINMLSSRCPGFLASVADTTQEEKAKLEEIPVQIKTGAPCRSECLAKCNQLLRIEELVSEALYAGANIRSPVDPY